MQLGQGGTGHIPDVRVAQLLMFCLGCPSALAELYLLYEDGMTSPGIFTWVELGIFHHFFQHWVCVLCNRALGPTHQDESCDKLGYG